jgi:hypothetical protein
VLLSKSDYPAELNIPLPFSLLNNNVSKDQLEIMPAYWWLYNMYALARNTWKFHNRDKRISKIQHIEFDAYAPDSMEEVFTALNLLEIWTAKASLRQKGKPLTGKNERALSEMGRKLLNSGEKAMNGLEVLGENLENSKRKVLIIKPYAAYHAYKDMLHYYAVINLLAYMRTHPDATFGSLCNDLKSKRKKDWVNLGGQIMLQGDLDKTRADIGSGKLSSWKDIHNRYDRLWSKYTEDKQKHAFATLLELLGKEQLTPKDWKEALNKVVEIQKYVCDQVYTSRKKDFDNPFRRATFRSDEEMKAAIGTVDENSFIVQVRQETEEMRKFVKEVGKRI